MPVVLTLMVAYFVLVPALVFLHHESKYRDRWRRRLLVDVPEPSPGGPFRDEEGDPAAAQRRYTADQRGAPREVKVVAVASLVLGHMFAPGLLAGLYGVFFYGLGLVSIPGLVLAAGIYRNAYGLLRCDAEAAEQARRLRKFAVGLNVLVLALVAMFALAEGLEGMVVFTGVYACISLLHAAGLGRAADAIDLVHSGAPHHVTRDALPYELARPTWPTA